MNADILNADFQYIFSKPLSWGTLAHKTILITGANGFIGSYLIEALLYRNAGLRNKMTIIGLARNKEKAMSRFFAYRDRSDFKLVISDVCRPIHIDEKVHYIIHAASQASPKYYDVDPVGTLKANVLGTYNLFEFSRSQPIKGFLFISSSEIYGNKGYLDPLDVRSCYAESKRMGETMCMSWWHQFAIPAKIVRLYHTYGPGLQLDDGRVYADFISNILRGQNIVIKGDGSAIRSFCYIADTAYALMTVLLKGRNGEAYNVANTKATVSIRKLAEILANLFPEKKLKVISGRRGLGDKYMESKTRRFAVDISSLRLLGWNPEYTLREGFERTIKSYETH